MEATRRGEGIDRPPHGLACQRGDRDAAELQLAPRLGAVLEAEREMRLPLIRAATLGSRANDPTLPLQAVTADTPAGARPAAAGKSHRRSVDLPPLQRGTCGELLARVRAEAA
jgi:hypothetical protein